MIRMLELNKIWKRIQEEKERVPFSFYKEKYLGKDVSSFEELLSKNPIKWIVNEETFREYGRAINFCIRKNLNFNCIQVMSKNLKAKKIVGLRKKGMPIWFPWELDYRCPICGTPPDEILNGVILEPVKKLISELEEKVWSKKLNQDSFNEYYKDVVDIFNNIWKEVRLILISIVNKKDNAEDLLNEVELDHLQFSEYNYFMYCYRCNLDIPSMFCLDMGSREKVIEYTERFLSMIKSIKAGEDNTN